MLTITVVSSRDVNKVSEYNWNIEENSSPLSVLVNKGVDLSIMDKIFVHVDDKELEYVLENFKNLPCHINKKSQSWSGDDAMFIIMNMV